MKRPILILCSLLLVLFPGSPQGFSEETTVYGRLRQKADMAAAVMREGDRARAETLYDQIWTEALEELPLEYCEPELKGRVASLYVSLAMGRGGLRSMRNDIEGVLKVYQEAAALVPQNAGPFYDAMVRSIVGRKDRDKIITRLESDEAMGLPESARDQVLGRVYAVLGEGAKARSFLRRAREAAMNEGDGALLAETDRLIESLP